VEILQTMAAELGGFLHPPRLSWKYSWIKAFLGWSAAKRMSIVLPSLRESVASFIDRVLYRLGRSPDPVERATNYKPAQLPARLT
jgi:hypothetical protein